MIYNILHFFNIQIKKKNWPTDPANFQVKKGKSFFF